MPTNLTQKEIYMILHFHSCTEEEEEEEYFTWRRRRRIFHFSWIIKNELMISNGNYKIIVIKKKEKLNGYYNPWLCM